MHLWSIEYSGKSVRSSDSSHLYPDAPALQFSLLGLHRHQERMRRNDRACGFTLSLHFRQVCCHVVFTLETLSIHIAHFAKNRTFSPTRIVFSIPKRIDKCHDLYIYISRQSLERYSFMSYIRYCPRGGGWCAYLCSRGSFFWKRHLCNACNKKLVMQRFLLNVAWKCVATQTTDIYIYIYIYVCVCGHDSIGRVNYSLYFIRYRLISSGIRDNLKCLWW